MEKENDMYVKQIIIITLAMLTIACKEKTEHKMEYQISYTVTTTAPEEYPIEVHIGYLLDQNKNLIDHVKKQNNEINNFNDLSTYRTNNIWTRPHIKNR